MRCLTPKLAACFLSVKGDLISKMLHVYVFDMQLFKKPEFGWVEKQYLQLNIKGCCMLWLHAVFEGKTTHFIGEISYYALSENLNKISKITIFWSKIVFLSKKFSFEFLL